MRLHAKATLLPSRGRTHMPDASAISLTAASKPDDLPPRLEALLRQSLGRPVSISRMGRRSSEFASRSSVEILDLTLNGNQELCLFLKHVGTDTSAHPDKALRTREPM